MQRSLKSNLQFNRLVNCMFSKGQKSLWDWKYMLNIGEFFT